MRRQMNGQRRSLIGPIREGQKPIIKLDVARRLAANTFEGKVLSAKTFPHQTITHELSDLTQTSLTHPRSGTADLANKGTNDHGQRPPTGEQVQADLCLRRPNSNDQRLRRDGRRDRCRPPLALCRIGGTSRTHRIEITNLRKPLPEGDKLPSTAYNRAAQQVTG